VKKKNKEREIKDQNMQENNTWSFMF